MPPMRKNVMVQRTDMTDYERNAMLDILRDRPARGNLILAVSGGCTRKASTIAATCSRA